MGSFSDEREAITAPIGTGIGIAQAKVSAARTPQATETLIMAQQAMARGVNERMANTPDAIVVAPAKQSLTLPGAFPDIGVQPVVVEAPIRTPPPVPPRPVSTDAGREGTIGDKPDMGIKVMQIPASDILGTIGNVASSYINARFAQPQTRTVYADNPFIPNQLEQFVDPGVAAQMQCPTPRYLTYDTKTGEYSVRRRRRRRKMLTASDVADLQIISTLPNNANVRAALATRIAKS